MHVGEGQFPSQLHLFSKSLGMRFPTSKFLSGPSSIYQPVLWRKYFLFSLKSSSFDVTYSYLSLCKEMLNSEGSGFSMSDHICKEIKVSSPLVALKGSSVSSDTYLCLSQVFIQFKVVVWIWKLAHPLWFLTYVDTTKFIFKVIFNLIFYASQFIYQNQLTKDKISRC
jgi:hypothetical protein